MSSPQANEFSSVVMVEHTARNGKVTNLKHCNTQQDDKLEIMKLFTSSTESSMC